MTLDWLIICLRLIQFGGAMVMFGSSLFLLYGKLLPRDVKSSDLNWVRSLLTGASLLLILAGPLQFFVQTTSLAGSFAGIFQDDALNSALFGMSFGKSSLVRVVLALMALLLVLIAPTNRRLICLTAILGALICASFAWMGHGAATESSVGWVHLLGDIVHSLAAAGWIGALVVFSFFLLQPPSAIEQRGLQSSLTQFSGVGTALVALLIVSGLINSAFLVGWNPGQIVASRYGQVLIAKLILFALMLVLAAANRFRHTPMLAESLTSPTESRTALLALRRSILSETAVAFGVLGLVSWLGTLAPVTAQ
jgi:putative copper resistance protein D